MNTADEHTYLNRRLVTMDGTNPKLDAAWERWSKATNTLETEAATKDIIRANVTPDEKYAAAIQREAELKAKMESDATAADEWFKVSREVSDILNERVTEKIARFRERKKVRQ